MRILGFELSKAAPVIKAGGTAFEERSVINAALAVTAAAPQLPMYSSDVGQYSMPGLLPRVASNPLPPFGTNMPRDIAGTMSASLEDRTVHSDPRELWYLAYPQKMTPNQCMQILRSALGGDLWQQWQLQSVMADTWPTYRMATHQLREAVAYAKYNVHPYAEDGEEPTKSAKEKAGLVARAIKSFEPNPFNDEKGFSGMVYDLCDAAMVGISMVELMWKDVVSKDHGKERMPRASAWIHPRHYTFTMAGELAVYDDTYARQYFNPQQQTGRDRVGASPDPKKFLAGQFVSRSGSALGAGFMRPLVWYWSARQFNNEWMLNTAKQYGSPFLDLTYKPNTPQVEIDALKKLAQVAGPERRIVHPEGTTAEVHQPSSLGKENPQRVLEEKADEACLFLLLGQKGTTIATPGKLGDDSTQENTKGERVKGLSDWVARNPLKQFARAVVMMNYDPSEWNEFPNIEADFTRPLSSAEVGGLMTSVAGSRTPVRADEFYRKTGFTKPEEGDVVLVGGEIMEQQAPMSADEKFEKQLEQQGQQAELQMQLQSEMQPEGPAQASNRPVARPDVVRASLGGRLQIALQKATGDELLELEQLAVTAKAAKHLNGEQAAFEKRVLEIATRK